MSEEKKPTCYIISPIGEEGSDIRCRADYLLVEIIERALDDKYEIIRADKEAKPGQIDSQIINAMFDANLVIANLTEQNANVFYELGIRHTASKPTIHMIDKSEVIPFDNSLSRTVKYSLRHPDDLRQAREALVRAVGKVEATDFEVENPVTKARGRYEYQEGATTPVEKQMLEALDKIESMERRLRSVEDVPDQAFLGLGAESERARGATVRNHLLSRDFLSGRISSGYLTDPNLTEAELAVIMARNEAIKSLEHERNVTASVREYNEIASAKALLEAGIVNEDNLGDDNSNEN